MMAMPITADMKPAMRSWALGEVATETIMRRTGSGKARKIKPSIAKARPSAVMKSPKEKLPIRPTRYTKTPATREWPAQWSFIRASSQVYCAGTGVAAGAGAGAVDGGKGTAGAGVPPGFAAASAGERK